MAAHDIVMAAAGASGPATYIEDVFSTYLYTGNGSTQTITNGIDLAGKGGMLWFKRRETAQAGRIFDTSRGINSYLVPSATDAVAAPGDNRLSSFNSTGFSLGSAAGDVNANAGTYASWTFRKQPKFFDVVTYTGDGIEGKAINHALGSVPGCIIVKDMDSASNDWCVYHQSLGNTKGMYLNATNAAITFDFWANTTPTSTQFFVANMSKVNTVGNRYVAYIFAHNAGGFGLTGTDNVISCGSYTGAYPSDVTVTLGYEPQLILVKNATTASDWFIYDNMRGMSWDTDRDYSLAPNAATAENGTSGAAQAFNPTATGFIVNSGLTAVNVSGNTHIYIAIRRGPMKVPTDATTLYGASTWSGPGSTTFSTFSPDLMTRFERVNFNTDTPLIASRMQGKAYLFSSATNAEAGGSFAWDQTGGGATTSFGASTTLESHFFKRAPGFMDVVCYTGTGSPITLNHNLGVTPELIICKNRTSAGGNWHTYSATLGNAGGVFLNLTNGYTAANYWNSTSPTSTQFTVAGSTYNSVSGNNHVAYLFATLAGVSKVGSYTGNGSSQTINCGFAAGARFILIKRTDSTGDWYVWDTARGIVAGNDGHMSFNTTASEVTTDDSIDPDNTGFIVNQLAATNVNVNAATYIFLAIA